MIQKGSIKIQDCDGQDITSQCKIYVKERSYTIETGKDLFYDQKMKVNYKVKVKNVMEKNLKNTAFAKLIMPKRCLQII